MKALEKDRNRRYQTANGVGMDVQRHLNNEPVNARPPSRLYRFQKLVRRNKAAFVAIGAVGLALIAGFGTSTWLFFREREARQEQVHLREEAELARNNETQLRLEAEAMMKITQAAVLLSHNKFEEAGQLVDKIAIPVAQPSLEAAGVFRMLGDWNVAQARWQPAAGDYFKFVQANQVDKSDLTDEASRDLFQVGPALVAAGDLAHYHQLIQTTIRRFASTTNPVAAEQVLKFSLILPVDQKTIRSLQPLAEVLKKDLAGEDLSNTNQEIYMAAWRAMALSLFEYRQGNYANAIAVGQRCLEYSESRPTCVAMSHLILAMANWQIHQPDAARSELAQGRKLIEPNFPNGLEKMPDLGSETSGIWHDWVKAYFLLHEAIVDIEGTPTASK
jgi:tetratricopeptide (TPR) repeat protein